MVSKHHWGWPRVIFICAPFNLNSCNVYTVKTGAKKGSSGDFFGASFDWKVVLDVCFGYQKYYFSFPQNGQNYPIHFIKCFQSTTHNNIIQYLQAPRWFKITMEPVYRTMFHWDVALTRMSAEKVLLWKTLGATTLLVAAVVVAEMAGVLSTKKMTMNAAGQPQMNQA